MLTNKIFSEKLNIPISKARRNTKEFLGEDPVAKRRTGFQREFSVNDGYFVYLGGLLVSDLGFSFHEARRILEDLTPWFFKIGFVPDIPNEVQIEGVEKETIMIDEINIYTVPESGEFRYLVKKINKLKVEKKRDSEGKEYEISNSKTVEFWLTEPYYTVDTHRTMELNMHTSHYIGCIKGNKGLTQWVNKQLDLRGF